jgi:hypothetical protein
MTSLYSMLWMTRQLPVQTPYFRFSFADGKTVSKGGCSYVLSIQLRTDDVAERGAGVLHVGDRGVATKRLVFITFEKRNIYAALGPEQLFLKGSRSRS